jgi:serine/threonine-protein kinase
MSRLACLALCLAALPAAATRAAHDDLPKKAMAVLDKYCSRCHGVGKVEGYLDVRDPKSLLSKSESEGVQYIVPKDAAKSYLWERMNKDAMPPSGAKPSAEEKQIVKEWIEAGAAASVEKEKPRPFISTAETIVAIRDHLRAADEDDQPYLRYFLLTNSHNDPRVLDADLRAYRAALSKAVNSLSWKHAIVLPEAIDKAGTIFVIDLRDLDWDARPGEKADMWQAMLKYYPYGLSYEHVADEATKKAAREIAKYADSQLIYMRADWFVATATRPPLYHTILRLPHTAYELEKKLGVDVAANFKRGRLWRAGLESSGVSKQNRLIERHDALYGAYWKSYDFKEGGRKSNLLEYPLGPDLSARYVGKYPYKDVAFVHDGGEVVFNLPNGLQGYFLLDGKDNRIDAGPIEVVDDVLATSGTPHIVTGLSCMTCHAKGMIFNPAKEWDVVRDATTVGGHMREKVQRLYPPHPLLKKKAKEDAALYLAALEKTTGPFLSKEGKKAAEERATEPVGNWARKYRNDGLGLEDVAYELGKTPDELRTAIENNDALQKQRLGVLLKGKKLKRAEWEELRGSSLFQRVAKILKLGVPLDPQ